MRFPGALLLAGALLSAGAAPAVAQKAGAVELGVFGRYTHFASDLNFESNPGIGGRFGLFVLRHLEVEGDASYTATYSQDQEFIRYIPIHARLVYNVPLGVSSALLLGAGYVHNKFTAAYEESASGAGGLLGLRFGTGEVISIRLDATADYIGNPANSSAPAQLPTVVVGDKNWHYGFQAGVSFLFGAKRDGDRDKDGVQDSLDQCPDTPIGDAVDATGCSLPKDADGDGVLDAADQCPNTPAGTAVDATGCPKDTDGDHVLDAADRCPNTPAMTPVDAHGCPQDADGDGVTDSLDTCPNTPVGTSVDTHGCPVDLDGDGVINDNDKCPGTPAGTKVDAVGCRALFDGGARLVLQGVNFATGKATLLPESQVILDGVAASLQNNPNVAVEVGGHTDNTGRRATNVKLSEARANAVRDYLISKGVTEGLLTAKGYGPDQPVADNTSVAGRAANRRVELTRMN